MSSNEFPMPPAPPQAAVTPQPVHHFVTYVFDSKEELYSALADAGVKRESFATLSLMSNAEACYVHNTGGSEVAMLKDKTNVFLGEAVEHIAHHVIETRLTSCEYDVILQLALSASDAEQMVHVFS